MSPDPTYKPSSRRMSTQARDARLTASTGAKAYIGMPPTPMPTFMWTGMRAAAMQGLTKLRARAVFQATDLLVFVLTAGP
jgi:hypothetical protein